jgi:hypothetical protein
LLEGRAVEFLYGNHGIARAMAAKNLIRGLKEHQQPAVIQFYIDIFSSLIKYHSSISRCQSVSSWFCMYATKDPFYCDVEIAFEKFKAGVNNSISYQS